MASSGDTFAIAPGSAEGQHYLIVEARTYGDIADALLDGARAALKNAGATFDVLTVPGCLEIPAAIAMASELKGDDYDGYVALGCVLREATHHEIIANESTRALMDLTVSDGIALGNGILTVDSLDQARAWANAAEEDRGGGAAIAALAMAAIRDELMED